MKEYSTSDYCGDKCPVCKGKAAVYSTENLDYKLVECDTCGRFEIPILDPKIMAAFNLDKLASYLYYKGKIDQQAKVNPKHFNFIGEKSRFEEECEKYPDCFHVTNDIVEIWFPKTFSEKVDMFLLGLSYKATYIGDAVSLTNDQIYSACFVIRNSDDKIMKRQVDYFFEYMTSEKYIDASNAKIMILPKGLKRIDELQKNIAKNSKSVFIAMSFDKKMSKVCTAIKEAISEAGFNPRIMNEIEHNHQIVPEMLYEIRQAKFVVAELTNHNNGAYFEAGYALGIGKEVIQVCKKKSFDQDGHFDVKQINTILWNSIDELKTALVNRIKATI